MTKPITCLDKYGMSFQRDGELLTATFADMTLRFVNYEAVFDFANTLAQFAQLHKAMRDD